MIAHARLRRRPLAVLALTSSLLGGLPSCSGGATSSSGPGGDPPTTGAAVLGATQDRDVDAAGTTLFVDFDAPLDPVDAADVSRYIVTGRSVTQASLAQPTRVQLTLDSSALPGETVVTIPPGLLGADGAASPGTTALAIVSTDDAAPMATRIGGVAVAGLNNDQATVEFDDLMVPTDVELINAWSVESPTGTPVDLTGATVTYDEASRSATITLGGNQNLETGAEISAVLTTMRDIGGNAIASTAFGADAVTSMVTGDTVPPTLLSIYPGTTPNTLRYIFDEPVRFIETADLITSVPTSGTRFTFESQSAPGVIQSAISSTSIFDSLGAEVTFGVAPAPGDFAGLFGVADLAGNEMHPVLAQGVEARLDGGPELFVGSTELIAVEGELNDIFRITFDRGLHPDNLFADYNYGLLAGFFVNTHGANSTWNGGATVTFELVGHQDHEVQTGTTYLLAVALLRSIQGEPIATTTYEYTVTPTGDSSPPTLDAARLHPTNAAEMLVEFSEAVDVSEAEDAAHYDLNGASAVEAELVSPRVVRVRFASAASVGQTLTVSQAGLRDRAGNVASAQASVALQAADAGAPALSGFTAAVVPGKAADVLTATFDELIDPMAAVDGSAYELTANGSTVQLTFAELTYASSTNAVTITLPDTLHLPDGASVTLEVTGIADVAGNVAGALSQSATVTGDASAPMGMLAFVNYRASAAGNVIDVTPNEALDISAAQTSAWSASGGQSVVSVTRYGFDRLRIELDSPLGSAETLSLTNATDLAGNAALAPIVADPLE